MSENKSMYLVTYKSLLDENRFDTSLDSSVMFSRKISDRAKLLYCYLTSKKVGMKIIYKNKFNRKYIDELIANEIVHETKESIYVGTLHITAKQVMDIWENDVEETIDVVVTYKKIRTPK